MSTSKAPIKPRAANGGSGRPLPLQRGGRWDGGMLLWQTITYCLATPTCSAHIGLQTNVVRYAQRMRCEFLISPLALPLFKEEGRVLATFIDRDNGIRAV